MVEVGKRNAEREAKAAARVYHGLKNNVIQTDIRLIAISGCMYTF